MNQDTDLPESTFANDFHLNAINIEIRYLIEMKLTVRKLLSPTFVLRRRRNEDSFFPSCCNCLCLRSLDMRSSPCSRRSSSTRLDLYCQLELTWWCATFWPCISLYSGINGNLIVMFQLQLCSFSTREGSIWEAFSGSVEVNVVGGFSSNLARLVSRSLHGLTQAKTISWRLWSTLMIFRSWSKTQVAFLTKMKTYCNFSKGVHAALRSTQFSATVGGTKSTAIKYMMADVADWDKGAIELSMIG